MTLRLKICALGALLPCAMSVAHASQTVFTVPVAGTLEPRRLLTSIQGDGSSVNSSDTTVFANVDYDVSRFVSLGIATRLTDGVTARPEGSLQFAPVGKPFAFAAGFANVGVRSFRSQPYLVGSTWIGRWGGYLGVTHDTYGEHAMLGANCWVTPKISLQGDWIGDDGNFLTLGARWQAARDFAILGGFSRANSHESHNGIFLGAEKDFKI
jgi:hypothetical protein